MEKGKEQKPNRVFRGKIAKALIELVNKPSPVEVVEEVPLGIGSATEVPQLRLVEDIPEGWHNWNDAA